VEGNIIVADNGNNRIRKINPSGIVSTLAGNESEGFLDGSGSAALFDGILAIAIDANGDIYIADASNKRIRKITGRK
jgi:DNA-binding beta-propeller fold protein YncE